ncbi:WPP domain-associated protein [Rutidosis leptorrhynchoides]|uniref:WPP domain-associated protein n=1 Tax=Rutidosis leptorrhynchoides TaxID=125765 RepID=UPI003A9A5CA8
MEIHDVLKATMAFHGSNGVNNIESKNNDENINAELLEDLDTMMEEVDNGIRISRMVSDSLIKGMVSAIEQEAVEKIKEKELEIENLKKLLSRSNVEVDKFASVEGFCAKRDEIKESALSEFMKIRKQFNTESFSEGFDLKKSVDNIELMMNNMSNLVDTVLVFNRASVTKCTRDEFQDTGSQNRMLAEKFSNISDLRKDLESLTKLLPSSNDSGHVSNGSFDADNTHGNALRSQLSLSNESKLGVTDSFDANSLKHMNKDELVKFFNNMILEIKRGHEAEVHRLTDNYISLKGKYLSERRSFVPNNKDLEVLKKKIPEVVSKLDNILSENDEFINKGDRVVSLNALLRDNHQLTDSLDVTKDELIEASVMEDVYTCFMKELNCKICDINEESEHKIFAMQDIYEVLLKNTSICAIENTSMESSFMLELLETVFKETLTDVQQKFETLRKECLKTCENLDSVQKKVTGMEGELITKGNEIEKLMNEVILLRNLAEEKEKLARDELNNLRKQASWQETLMSKTNKELDEMSDKLSKAQEQLLSDKMEINSLKQELEVAKEETKELNNYKNMVPDLSQKNQSFISRIEAKEKEHKKQIEAVVVLIDELSTKFADFECRVIGGIISNRTRLENSRSQLSSLIKATNVLKSTGIIYKQKLERKCHDLQMAEDEVDLLGDEVDTLLGLLEKIYIALDHYSPVLQHYPGVIEILELVRRELSGESLKPH